ncbi:MAG: hypothetical protein ACP5E5_15630 [Acidobacteriaceae bacterium]
MVFDFSEEGKVKVDMSEYIANMVDDFPIDLKPTDTAPTPAADDLFSEGEGPKLDKDKARSFSYLCCKRFVCLQKSKA